MELDELREKFYKQKSRKENLLEDDAGKICGFVRV